jgi:hypothetical protein
VDPWAHFVNVYMLDRYGNRIDRRNPQDIFTPLYNHQIPPGAAQVVHYRFQVPEQQVEPLTVEVKLQYRKFDTIYLNYVQGTDYRDGRPLQVTNDLPIVTISADRITFPIATEPPSIPASPTEPSLIPEWQRWNDYGIGLFLEERQGQRERGADPGGARFCAGRAAGPADGPLNRARVYLKEGRLDDAVAALQRAARCDPPPPRWTLAWLNGWSTNKRIPRPGHRLSSAASWRIAIPNSSERRFDFTKRLRGDQRAGPDVFREGQAGTITARAVSASFCSWR